MRIDAKELVETMSHIYKKKHWPNKDYEDLLGYSMKSKDQDFVEAANNIIELISMKGRELKFQGISFKIHYVTNSKASSHACIQVDGGAFEKENIEFKWWLGNSGTCLQLTRVKGADVHHLKLMLYVFITMMDDLLDKRLLPVEMKAFIVSDPEPDVAKLPGVLVPVVAGAPAGAPAPVAAVNGKEGSNVAQELMSKMMDYVVHTGLVKFPQPVATGKTGKETLPLPPTPAPPPPTASSPGTPAAPPASSPANPVQVNYKGMNAPEYIKMKYPTGAVRRVAADHLCGPKSLSETLFDNPDQWKEIRTVINRRKRRIWSKLKSEDKIPYPYKVIKRGETKYFEDDMDEEFCQLLDSEEGLYVWMDHLDLKLFSDFLGITIEVIVAKDDKLEGKPQLASIRYPGNKIVLLLDTATQHYSAVVNTCKVDTAKIFYEMKKYITRTSAAAQSGTQVHVEKVDSNGDLRKQIGEQSAQIKELKTTCSSLRESNIKLRDEFNLLESNCTYLGDENVKLREDFNIMTSCYDCHKL